MAEEPGAGASYLSALKQSGSPQAAGAAPARSPDAPQSARAPEAAAPIHRAPKGMERRRSPRYKCQGSVRLQEIGSTAGTWATISDIGIHGCYLETTASYRIGATLRLRLEVNNFRIDAVGEVRAVYPQLGVGIFFTSMSSQDRERLHELLRSIIPNSVVLNSIGGNHASAIPAQDALPLDARAADTLQAISKFFEHRHVMGRDEFLRILENTRTRM